MKSEPYGCCYRVPPQLTYWRRCPGPAIASHLARFTRLEKFNWKVHVESINSHALGFLRYSFSELPGSLGTEHKVGTSKHDMGKHP